MVSWLSSVGIEKICSSYSLGSRNSFHGELCGLVITGRAPWPSALVPPEPRFQLKTCSETSYSPVSVGLCQIKAERLSPLSLTTSHTETVRILLASFRFQFTFSQPSVFHSGGAAACCMSETTLEGGYDAILLFFFSCGRYAAARRGCFFSIQLRKSARLLFFYSGVVAMRGCFFSSAVEGVRPRRKAAFFYSAEKGFEVAFFYSAEEGCGCDARLLFLFS